MSKRFSKPLKDQKVSKAKKSKFKAIQRPTSQGQPKGQRVFKVNSRSKSKASQMPMSQGQKAKRFSKPVKGQIDYSCLIYPDILKNPVK